MRNLILLALFVITGCSSGGSRCISETDKTNKHLRHKFNYNSNNCPHQGNYYKWGFVFNVRAK